MSAVPAPLPQINAFATLLGTLLGQRPKVTKGAMLVANKLHTVATYIDDESKHVYAAVADVAFVAGAGAALALIPARMVQECIKSGSASETMTENTYEVLNIGASLFNEIENTKLHVKIDRMDIHEKLTKELVSQIARPTARLDLVVGITGYPDAKISLLALT